MSSVNLTQTDLNESLRGLDDVDIMMFLPDKSISFPSNAVTTNTQALSYTTNIQSVVTFSNLPQVNIATFENNSWILDGSFVSPSEVYGGGGDSYAGYISNDYTDDNGDYSTNPIITIALSATAANIKYLSIKFAGGIDTSYPKTFKIRTYDNSDTLIREHTYDMSTQSGLPLLVAEINDNDVKKVAFEFVGTQCPHRRSRLNKIMFGKAEQINSYYLQSWKVDDKASLVADSIPTKMLSYSVINYDGDYDIDNPGNRIPNNYKDVLIFFTFAMEKDGLWKYAPTKTFNLTDISTTPEGVVTFTCGSLLDILTETYDQDIYTGKRTIGDITQALLSFSDVGIDQCLLNEFSEYEINIPLPELPVRELIQRMAFSCGATLTVNDDNKIVFSKKNISLTNDIPKFMFNQPEPFNSAGVLLEEPNVEALANTTNIAMCTYETIVDSESSEIGSANISTIQPTKITYSPVMGGILLSRQDVVPGQPYSQHAIVTAMIPENDLPVNVKIFGLKAETTKIIPKTVNIDTLILDSGLAYKSSHNDTIMTNLIRPSTDADSSTFYYTDWYGAKFKYKCKTRNEYLVKAGDIIYFETPFSNKEPNRLGYVLRNSYSNNEDSGEMEVIRLDGNN